jgi:hypothetical protein
MNKNELANKLQEKGINPNSYCLDGGLPNEAYCLNNSANGWEVYYSERGDKSGLKIFQNESDACIYLYKLLVNDTN